MEYVKTGAVCPFIKNEDCFSRRGRFCDCLQDTSFNKGNCPFYKTKKQYEEDLKNYPFTGNNQSSKKKDK